MNTKTVKFIRSVSVQGEHCEVGATKEVPEVIAEGLIISGSASYITKPVKQEPENASVKPRENALKIKK